MEHFDVCDECRAGLLNSPAELYAAIVRPDGLPTRVPITTGTVGGMMTLAFHAAVGELTEGDSFDAVTALGTAMPYTLLTDWGWYAVVTR